MHTHEQADAIRTARRHLHLHRACRGAATHASEAGPRSCDALPLQVANKHGGKCGDVFGVFAMVDSADVGGWHRLARMDKKGWTTNGQRWWSGCWCRAPSVVKFCKVGSWPERVVVPVRCACVPLYMWCVCVCVFFPQQEEAAGRSARPLIFSSSLRASSLPRAPACLTWWRAARGPPWAPGRLAASALLLTC